MNTVSIVIPTHNRREKLTRLLRDLEHQDFPDGEYEVIVVDDGSTDATKAAVLSLSTHYPLHYHRQECRGPAAARNAGIRMATGEYVILLDDDMRVRPGLIRSHLDTQARFGDVVVIGPGWLAEDLPATAFVRYRKWLDKRSAPVTISSSVTTVQSVSSANTSARRALLERVGRYCEDMALPGAEEAELSWRLSRSAVPIVYDSAIPASQDDAPVTFAGYCAKHERYGMAGAEVVVKLPHVADELASIRALVAVNGAGTSGSDYALVARKAAKELLSRKASLAFLMATVAFLEHVLPLPFLLWPLYRLVIGLHIYRGFRRGMAALRVGDAGLAPVSHAG